MKQTTLQIFEDPGHAWARVPRKRLIRLGIADKVSVYSYQNKDNVFLEEDCDLPLMVNALKERGYEVKFKTSHTERESKIRKFNSYQPA